MFVHGELENIGCDKAAVLILGPSVGLYVANAPWSWNYFIV